MDTILLFPRLNSENVEESEGQTTGRAQARNGRVSEGTLSENPLPQSFI